MLHETRRLQGEPLYERDRALISLHIPKTAGTSLRQALAGWFGADLALHYRGHRGEAPPVATMRPGLCVHGHFNRVRGLGAREHYPDASQFIVFLREPFDRFVSQWRYLHFQRRSGVTVTELNDEPCFGTWLDRRWQAAEAGDDPFSFLAQFPDQMDAGAAQPFGPEYLFVGLVERYEVSLARLSDTLGFPPIAPARLNTAHDEWRRKDPQGDFEPWRARHEAAFPEEYAIYAAAARHLARPRFEQQVAA